MEAELKSLLNDIINGYLNYISSDVLKDSIFNLIDKNYNKGLSHGELNFNMNFLPNYQTVSFMQNFAFDNITKLTDDIKDNLRKEMSMGLMNGETIPALKLRIQKVMDVSIERAGMIARTESVRAFNVGHFEAAKASGLVLVKEWTAQPERDVDNPCPICEALDRQQVAMDGKFKASNGEEYLLPPVHPHCKCRCIYVQEK